jgi:hypothetical protein
LEELDELYETLIAESELVLKFSKEYEELHVWLTDTQSMLEVTVSPSNPGGMGVPASPAQLRGKHQVRGVAMGITVSPSNTGGGGGGRWDSIVGEDSTGVFRTA